MVREGYPEVVTSVGLELALLQAGDAGEIWVGRRYYEGGGGHLLRCGYDVLEQYDVFMVWK